ncbi:winged helix-turn-helix transcriptional regulator [Marinobacter orientalis]|uniref:winged helix-turn-helix transcriptional regulator n=1 Tax=Marinobacter orientalis TaxID=1928859 RepID=UPI00198183B6|nr:helix-turn-helix domain-containing protein [Marinobacter orientalis]
MNPAVSAVIGGGDVDIDALGSEILGERWTPLVVGELLCGSTHFNEIRRGLPRMSATLLAQRLKKLEEVGVLQRVQEGSHQEYLLTPAGEELRLIILSIGHWGARWIGSRLQANQLDAGFLMWDIRRFARIDEFPSDRRVVIHFFLNDARHRERHWWLVVANGEIDLCREDPGHELTLEVEASVASLTEIWSGDSDPEAEQQARRLLVRGSPQDSRDPRAVAGAERVCRQQTCQRTLFMKQRLSNSASHLPVLSCWLRLPGST